MTYILALIGTARMTSDDVEDVVRFHLETPAFWTTAQHVHWARGTRVVAKIVGAKVLVLTGRLDCLQPVHDPLVDEDLGKEWPWRYDVHWDPQPHAVVPVERLGAPFVHVRATRTISPRTFYAPIVSFSSPPPETAATSVTAQMACSALTGSLDLRCERLAMIPARVPA